MPDERWPDKEVLFTIVLRRKMGITQSANPEVADPVPATAWAPAFARRTLSSGSGDITAILALAASTEVITFSGGFPAPETFPHSELPGMLARLLEDGATTLGSRSLQYGPTPGLDGFRSALADRLASTERRRPAEGELLVTSGGIDALALVGRAFLDAGDLVAVEEPTYLGAITAFRCYEADILEVPIDAAGLDVEQLERRLGAGARPKLVYVVPDHQNPTGQTLSAERRHALVALCRRYGVLIVEDVAYRDLGETADRLESLWEIGPDVTVQIGTFSKIFTPGFRLGWAVGPEPVIAQMVRAKQNADQCSGSLGQCLAESYLRSGALEAQLPRSRALYNERRHAMLDALGAHLPAGFTWTRPTGGFFVWVTGPAGLDTVALAPRAVEAGVAYVAGAPFYAGAGKGRHELRLAYSRATPAEIDEGVSRLGALLKAAG
jgi:2-aminoadipate transaminase